MAESFIFRVVVLTLASVMAITMAVLLAGLFDPLVDNKEIFAIVGPAFHTIVGCFVGLLSAKWMEKKDG